MSHAASAAVVSVASPVNHAKIERMSLPTSQKSKLQTQPVVSIFLLQSLLLTLSVLIITTETLVNITKKVTLAFG